MKRQPFLVFVAWACWLGILPAYAGNAEWSSEQDWSTGQVKNITWKDAKGQIQLIKQPPAEIKNPYLYITNMKSNNVVQINPKTGEVNWTFRFTEAGFPDGEPSRLMVDSENNVWVGLRKRGEVVCISPKGKLVTSLTVGKSPRAIAVDRDGNIWVGGHSTDYMVKIDKKTKKKIAKVHGVNCPYGADVDSNGDIWVLNRCYFSPGKRLMQITKISSETNRVMGVYQAYGGYGIAGDRKGQIWVSSFEKACVYRFDLNGKNLGCTPTQGRGRCVAIDGKGNAWVACSHKLDSNPDPYDGTSTRWVAKVGSDGTFLQGIPNVGLHSIGIAVERNNDTEHVWVISYQESKVYKLNAFGKLVGSYSTGGNYPYTYSGMTGFSTRFQFQQAKGHWRVIYDAKSNVAFQKLDWLSKEPDGTVVDARVRSASSKKGLTQVAWSAYTKSGEALEVSDNRWIEIDIQLRTNDNRYTPTVEKVTLSFGPPGSKSQGNFGDHREEEPQIPPGCGCHADNGPTSGVFFFFLVGLFALLRRKNVA